MTTVGAAAVGRVGHLRAQRLVQIRSIKHNDVIGPVFFGEVCLRGRCTPGYDARAPRLGELDRRNTDATGCACDQCGLARLHHATLEQRKMSGLEGEP